MDRTVRQIYKFNTSVLGMQLPDTPSQLHPSRKAWTHTALLEELNEFQAAESVEEQIDALADMTVFALGRFMEMGVDPRPVFDLISEKNLQKVRGMLTKRPGSMGYDAIKPEGWTPPEHVLQPFPKKKAAQKVLVLGHARHGKDTVAALLEKYTGLTAADAGAYIAENIVMPIMPYATVAECYADRVNHREKWSELIIAKLGDDSAALGRALLEQHDIYCGVRTDTELAAIRREFEPIVLWVDASGRRAAEVNAFFSVDAGLADIVIDNNDSYAALEERVERLASILGLGV